MMNRFVNKNETSKPFTIENVKDKTEYMVSVYNNIETILTISKNYFAPHKFQELQIDVDVDGGFSNYYQLEFTFKNIKTQETINFQEVYSDAYKTFLKSLTSIKNVSVISDKHGFSISYSY